MPLPTTQDDSDDDLMQAMAQSSPVRPAASSSGTKRHRTSSQEGQSDDEETPTTVTVPGTPNQGTVNQNLAAAKTELDVFINDPPALREAKIYAQSLHLENLITKIVAAAPPWAVSDDLLKNIYSYGAAILLSAKLPAYKGNIPKNILFAILKKHRFDLPPGIEHNPTDWSKVKKAVENALTQLRSKFKKAIGASLKSNPKDKNLLPKSERKNIFQLTQGMVENTQCEVNVLLCARVALMRKHFIKDSSPSYWNTVDEGLAKGGKTANGDSTQISRAFRHILKKDREKHGVDDFELEDTIDAFQEDMGNMIAEPLGLATQ
ncbi:hypothetical protein DFH09DRAFT_1325132 [Mycena vulgaris]|nr:hypothetical protein DFH09DRAFT_1325132 [Mycena vulgaris]